MKGETYEEFVEKFEIRKTTDDCYTPKNIYDAVAGYVERRYCLARERFVRPFFPGGDYENFVYDETSVVVDNPPFSILSSIIRFYSSKNIKFFLFAPALTLLAPTCDGYCGIAVGAPITYENGARISTSFVTNLENDIARTSPTLYKIVTEENKKNERGKRSKLPKYNYPDNVVTAAFLQRLSKCGERFSIPRNEAVRISALDMQKEHKKTIFGKALLCSEAITAEKAAAEKAAEKAAAEKAAAEKAAEKENAVTWLVSAREKKIIEGFRNADQR